MSAITNPMEMTGQTILVTGASSGIGRDTSVLLSELGSKVILVGRNEERLDETLKLMSPGEHHISAFDLRKHDEIDDWMKGVIAEAGLIDGLVHSAGIDDVCAVRHMEIDAINDLLSINLTAALVLAKSFRKKGVRSKQSAALVFLSSVAGLAGASGQACYSASKAGLLGLGRSLALELARENIRVNCVVPGFLRTEMTEDLSANLLTEEQITALTNKHPIGLGTPRDVSNAIAYLLSDTGRWITGSSLVVDGGYLAI